MTELFAGRVAFVTGAARGQGRSHAVRLAEEGAHIIAVDICRDIDSNPYPLATEKDLAETCRLIELTGQRVLARRVDVRDIGQVRSALTDGVREFGGVDIVVANAGICPMGANVSAEGFIDAVMVDLVGVINTVDASLPHLRPGASIVCIGSVAGMMTMGADNPSAGPGAAGYAHAKRGVARFVHDLAAQLAPQSIRVNAIHPTNVDTDMLHSAGIYSVFRPDLENPSREDVETAFPAMHPMPLGYLNVADVTNAVVFLASDAARYITGLQMKIDGGALLASTSSGAPG